MNLKLGCGRLPDRPASEERVECLDRVRIPDAIQRQKRLQHLLDEGVDSAVLLEEVEYTQLVVPVHQPLRVQDGAQREGAPCLGETRLEAAAPGPRRPDPGNQSRHRHPRSGERAGDHFGNPVRRRGRHSQHKAGFDQTTGRARAHSPQFGGRLHQLHVDGAPPGRWDTVRLDHDADPEAGEVEAEQPGLASSLCLVREIPTHQTAEEESRRLVQRAAQVLARVHIAALTGHVDGVHVAHGQRRHRGDPVGWRPPEDDLPHRLALQATSSQDRLQWEALTQPATAYLFELCQLGRLGHSAGRQRAQVEGEIPLHDLDQVELDRGAGDPRVSADIPLDSGRDVTGVLMDLCRREREISCDGFTVRVVSA